MALPAAFAPLRHPVFRTLWLGTLAGNVGGWMQSTAAGWMMTGLDPRPLMVALVQAASLLPVFLLALPAGTIADLTDRRLFLLAAQIWTSSVALLLAVLAAFGLIGPWGLIAFTFALGIGTAMSFPAWAATTPELVPREDLVGAIALNGIGFNLARAVGPAFGGLIVATLGTSAAFAANAVGSLILTGAIATWPRAAEPRGRRRERLLPAMAHGVRFVAATPALLAAIIRACTFFFFSTAVWGLLPLVVRDRLGLGAEGFGLMLAAMGAGAVAAGFGLPAIRARFDRGQLVFLASLVTAASIGVLALSTHWLPATLALLVQGAAWITAGSTTSVAAQLAAPGWVRARAIAIFQLSFFGAMALGSTLAGWLGGAVGVVPTLGAIAVASAAAAAGVRRWRLDPAPIAGPAAATPPVPEPAAAAVQELLEGAPARLLEVIRYDIDPADRAAFHAAMREVRLVRLRAGAMVWHLYEDIARPDRWVELWEVANWDEHLREAGRLTDADQGALAAAWALHRGATPPEAARYLNVAP